MRLKFVSAVALGTLLFGNVLAENFVAGKDYGELPAREPTSSGDKVEILEFFSYACPHCANLEPHLQAWAAGEASNNVRLRRIPIAWNKGMEPFARVFYAADLLDAPEEAHAAMFKLIHEDKPAQLSLPIIADVFARHGVDREAFIARFGSDEVSELVEKSKELTRRYRVTGVPTLIIGGFYTVGIPRDGDFDRMFAVTDYLVAKSGENNT